MPIRDEKSRAVAGFAGVVHSYPDGINIDTIMSDAHAIQQEICPDYPDSGIATFLFRYYGSVLLSKVIPNLQTVHARIDYEDPSIELLDTNPIPAKIQNYSSDDIIGITGAALLERTAKRRAGGIKDRAQISDGLCDSVSRKVVRSLSEEMPSIEPELTRIDWDASRPSGTARHPNILPLGVGHSVVRLAIIGDDARLVDNYLNIDPTIAQVDETDDYDIELTIVPSYRYDDFIRLHYGARPDTTVQIRPASLYI